MRSLFAILAVAVTLGFTSFTQADVFSVDVVFSGTPTEPEQFALSGKANFVFNTDTFTTNFQDNIPLISLMIEPSVIGSTTFDTSNSRALVVFADNDLKNLRSIAIGGISSGPGGVSSGTDDWQASRNFETNNQSVLYSEADGGIETLGNPSVEITLTKIIPEPNSILCLYVAGLYWTGKRRKRNFPVLR